MSALRAALRPPRSRSRRDRNLRSLAAAAPAFLVLTALAVAQTWTGAPQPPPDLKAALAAADAGAPGELLKLADGGRPDAQYYAGVMLLTGRGGVAKDPAKGCAYEEKAAAARPDAASILGQCYRQGLNGGPDPAKAKAAFGRAIAMGYTPAKCALGQMLMAEPAEASRGLALCKEAAEAGDVDAQQAVGDAYFRGGPAPRDHAEARRWYAMAAERNDPQAARTLGEMYANGDGGKRDTKKAVELWRKAEQAGDPLACILVADQLFADITGGKKPGPGTYAFKGGVPVADIEVVESWYREALKRDPRPDVQQRAKYAIQVLASFKTAAGASVKKGAR
jgi:TPR repeat protein